MNKFAGLSSKRLKLRDFTAEDLPTFAAYRNDPDIARYQSWKTYDMTMAQAFFEAQQALSFGEEGSWYQIAVTDAATDKILGDCVIHFLEADGDGEGQQVELGFTLAGEHQSKGIAKEAMICLLDFLFIELKKHRVIAFTDVENTGASGLLENLNFRQEAHFVENILFKGCWGSEYLYALLRREYLA